MIIYLLGLPSSGKTTLGKELAKYLNLGFIDMDHEIERAVELSIPEIFTREGEEKFRVYEQKILHAVSQKKDQVISTGGGAPCFFDNIEVMNKTGLTVFIDVSPAEIVKRLKLADGTSERPLLKDINPLQLETELTEKLKKRYAFYQKAQIILSNDNLDLNQLSEAINNKLND